MSPGVGGLLEGGACSLEGAGADASTRVRALVCGK